MEVLHILMMDKLNGAEKLALILCQNLQKFKPIVVCGGETLAKKFADVQITNYSVDFQNNNRLKSLRELKKIIINHQVKIVHAHDNQASINAYLLKKIYGLDIQVISHIHNCYPWLKTENMIKRIDRFFRNRYDYNIACGSLVYEHYERYADYIDLTKVGIFSNAIDVDEIQAFSSLENQHQQCLALGINPQKFTYGFIGRFAAAKGILPLLEMIGKNRYQFLDSQIILIGSGTTQQEYAIKTIIQEYELEEIVVLLGQQENVYQFYPLMDVFFLPSQYEGLPMVILEAMGFQKIVVAMDVGSIHEVVKHDYNGFLVPAGNYQKFIDTLRRVKQMNDKLPLLEKNALKTIQEKYDIKNYAQEIEVLYTKLIAEMSDTRE